MMDMKQKEQMEELVNVTSEMQSRQTDQEVLQAEILLNQMEILINQNAQDEAMAAILLNQMEV